MTPRLSRFCLFLPRPPPRAVVTLRLSRFCLFLPCPPSRAQSCYDWIKHNIWQKNNLKDTKQIQFKVVSWFFMVFGWFPWFFMVAKSWCLEDGFFSFALSSHPLKRHLVQLFFISWRVLFTSLPSILGLLEIDLPSTGFIFIISESITCRKFPFEYIYVVLEIIDD